MNPTKFKRNNNLYLTGCQFGRWTVFERANTAEKGRQKYRCRCNCGAERVLVANELLRGKTHSCGCLARELSAARATHGHTRGGNITPEYRAWARLIQRCSNPALRCYQNYGGRGINVCVRWQEPNGQGFLNFLADMGERPSPEHSIDRIDNNGGYSPENCRWATRVEQQRNRRTTIRITFQGQSLTLKEWAAKLGIKYTTLHARLITGWRIERMLTVAIRQANIKVLPSDHLQEDWEKKE